MSMERPPAAERTQFGGLPGLNARLGHLGGPLPIEANPEEPRRSPATADARSHQGTIGASPPDEPRNRRTPPPRIGGRRSPFRASSPDPEQWPRLRSVRKLLI